MSGPATSGRTDPTAGPGPWPPPIEGLWVVDLDGVVWLAGEAIAGAPDAIARLRRRGADILFATNNSSPTTSELLARLARIGIPADGGDLVTSAQAAASVVPRGARVVILGDEGLREALAQRQVTSVLEGPADAVVVGWARDFDFELLNRAAAAVRGGARLVGTNEDPTHPTPTGLVPGTGAILAAVATASGTEPFVAGKPHTPFVDLVVAAADRKGREIGAVVGDRPSTDGATARLLGVPFGLVLTGVSGGVPRTSHIAEVSEPVPDAVAEDLAALVAGVAGVAEADPD
jgi:4-nitrophenyl phosphatase